MSERILATGLRFPEGPAFDARGNLWAVELQGGGLVRWRGDHIERIPTDGAPNGLTFDRHGRAVFCDADQGAIRAYDPSSGELKTLADRVDGEPLFRPNDLAYDSVGNLVFTNPGDSRTDPTGYLCVLRPDGTVRKIGAGFRFCNGLAFTPDGQTLIVAETYRQRLWRGAWDAPSATWHAPRVWTENLGGAPGPDGMAFAPDGTLWVAVYGSGSVVQLDPGGQIIARLSVPGKNPTNCAFDPTGALGLVVTEAERGALLTHSLTPAGHPILAQPHT